MTDAPFEFSKNRNAYVMGGLGEDGRTRLVIPLDFVNEEVGAAATEAERLDWIRARLPEILQAYTARAGGGRVKEPWNRVLVEEVD